MIHELKDKALSKSINLAASALLKPYGTLLDLRWESRSRTIELKILLRGEQKPLSLTAHNVRIHKEDERSVLLAERIESSREWINVLAEKHFNGRSVEIPRSYAKILAALL